MTPPDNTNKPRQFLRPGLPFQEAPVQENAGSFLNEGIQQKKPSGQAPVTGEYASQNYGVGGPPASFGSEAGSEQPWLFAGTGMVPTPPVVQQPSTPIDPLATENKSPSQFSKFMPGKQSAQQHGSIVTGEYAASGYPVTGKQQISPFKGPPFTGSGLPAYRGTQPSVPSMPAQPGGQAGIQMPGFQMSAPSMPAYPETQPSAPSMPAFPSGPQYTSASHAAVGAQTRSSARMPAAPKQRYSEPRKPLKEPRKPLKESRKPLKGPSVPGKKKGISVLVGAVCLLLVVAVVLVSQRDALFGVHNKAQTSTQSNIDTSPTPSAPALNSITNNKDISPFLFGANMALFHDYDEPMLNSAATRRLLQNIGVRIVRMPTRTTLKPETTIAAARAIKEMGASALVVMHGPEFKEAPLYEADQKVIQTIVNVFGNQTVYFEFGNESDLNGIDVNQYILKWNQVIPKLKQQFPTARFIALDNYQFTRRYMKSFLEQANPLPDGVSWHEYTCSVTWSADFCLSNIDTWAIHFAQARAAMQEAIHKELPIWISEWNYTSDQAVVNGQPINDGKYNNPAFMQAWTAKAMKSLIDNRIFAAMQYFATDLPMPLVSNDQIAIEGKIFQQNYQTIMVDNKTPPASYYTGPPPPILNPNAQYSFETPGTSNWMAIGGGMTQAMNSTAKALDGTHSLMFNLANNSEDDTPFISVYGSKMSSTPKGGQMISAYLYVVNPNALVNAKIFVADPTRAWHFANSVTLTPGKWTRIWYSLPLNFSNQVSQLGIQFFTSRTGQSSDIYLDGVEWK